MPAPGVLRNLEKMCQTIFESCSSANTCVKTFSLCNVGEGSFYSMCESVSEMTYNVSSGTLNLTHSLTVSHVTTSIRPVANCIADALFS